MKNDCAISYIYTIRQQQALLLLFMKLIDFTKSDNFTVCSKYINENNFGTKTISQS